MHIIDRTATSHGKLAKRKHFSGLWWLIMCFWQYTLVGLSRDWCELFIERFLRDQKELPGWWTVYAKCMEKLGLEMLLHIMEQFPNGLPKTLRILAFFL